MPKSKILTYRVLTAAILILLFLSMQASAAVTGFVAKDAKGDLFEYRYEDLLDSYALKLLGKSNGLFEDFTKKSVFALLDSKNGYLDYNDILDQYAASVVAGKKFDLLKYTESSDAKKAEMPSIVKLVELNSGTLVHSTKTIGTGHTGSNPPSGSVNKTPIAGKAGATLEQAQLWAKNRSAHQRFIDIAPLYWHYGELIGIRPEVLYAQAALETNFGKYTGQVPPEYNNWAGIKIAAATDDKPEDHDRFATPEDGVRGHFNHMAAYVGLSPFGETHERYAVVISQSWAGSIRYVEELSGRWAPSAEYHLTLLNLLDQIMNTKTNTASPINTNGGLAGKNVLVGVDILRLRNGPGLDYEIIDRLNLGTILTVEGNQNDWLKVVTPGGRDGWVHGDYVTVADVPKDLFKGKTIGVDPGHGGSDRGAIGVTGVMEKVINLSVAKHLIALLEEAGAKVVTTRTSDISISHAQRAEIINKAKVDLFISIHANAFTNPESNGTETHYSSLNNNGGADKYLAEQIQREMVAALNLRDRGVKSNSFYILTNVDAPAALVELAFLTNPEEEALLSKPKTHGTVAQALFKGIEAYLLKYR
ncbi:MAG: N-acetylmuramoyl-L-alanine amidase [Bacillota bacterium]|nr:N-acetylmuramoyl-L-alanine amidase [Bacillota bacterium]